MDAKEDIIIVKTAYDLAQEYGQEMLYHGMSKEWQSPIDYPDTTDKLQSDIRYLLLPEAYQTEIMSYGKMMKSFGMGSYQEDTPESEFYFKCGCVPPLNPFALRLREARKRALSLEGGQFGE